MTQLQVTITHTDSITTTVELYVPSAEEYKRNGHRSKNITH